MSLKEDWSNQDILTYNDIDDILDMLDKIDTRLSISYPFPKTVKRNIQVGDNLSGKTLYLELPDNLFNRIILDVGSGQGNILVTDEGNSLIEYVNATNNVATVSINSWMDMLYYANTSTSEVYTNLSQVQLPEDFGIITELNNLSALQYIYIIDEGLEYKLGDFLTSEVLQKIENNLEILASIVNTSFEKRNWYYLSVITFEDVKRWCIFLNIVYRIVFEESANIITEAEEKIITEDNNYLVTEGGV